MKEGTTIVTVFLTHRAIFFPHNFLGGRIAVRFKNGFYLSFQLRNLLGSSSSSDVGDQEMRVALQMRDWDVAKAAAAIAKKRSGE